MSDINSELSQLSELNSEKTLHGIKTIKIKGSAYHLDPETESLYDSRGQQIIRGVKIDQLGGQLRHHNSRMVDVFVRNQTNTLLNQRLENSPQMIQQNAGAREEATPGDGDDVMSSLTETGTETEQNLEEEQIKEETSEEQEKLSEEGGDTPLEDGGDTPFGEDGDKPDFEEDDFDLDDFDMDDLETALEEAEGIVASNIDTSAITGLEEEGQELFFTRELGEHEKMVEDLVEAHKYIVEQLQALPGYTAGQAQEEATTLVKMLCGMSSGISSKPCQLELRWDAKHEHFAIIGQDRDRPIGPVENYDKFQEADQLNHLKSKYAPQGAGRNTLSFSQKWLIPVLQIQDHVPPEENKRRAETFFAKIDGDMDQRDGRRGDPIEPRDMIRNLSPYPDVAQSQLYNRLTGHVVRQLKAPEVATIGRSRKRRGQQYSRRNHQLTSVRGNYQVLQAQHRRDRQSGMIIDIDQPPNITEPDNLRGERLPLAGYYKLPIGFTKDYYVQMSALDLKKTAKLVTGPEYQQREGWVTASSQTPAAPELYQEALDQLLPSQMTDILDIYADLLEKSDYLDIDVFESLMKYFETDFKYARLTDLEQWEQLVKKKMSSRIASHQVEKLMKPLYRQETEEALTVAQTDKSPYQYYQLSRSTANAADAKAVGTADGGRRTARKNIDRRKQPSLRSWKQVFDQLDNGRIHLTELSKQAQQTAQKHEGRYQDLLAGLGNLPEVREVDGASAAQFGPFQGRIRDFPSPITNSEQLDGVLVWEPQSARYLRREDYLADLSNQHRVAEQAIRKQLEDGLVEKHWTQQANALELQEQAWRQHLLYALFYQKTRWLDPTRLAGRLPIVGIGQQQSPELNNLHRLFHGWNEQRRMVYLQKMLKSYEHLTDGSVADRQGRYLCCQHVPFWLEFGDLQTVEEFGDEARNGSIHCRICRYRFRDQDLDEGHDYVDGKKDIIGEVIFGQQNDLNDLKKEDELTRFAFHHFLGGGSEDSLRNQLFSRQVRLNDQLIFRLIEKFQSQLSGPLASIGLTQSSKATQPDVSQLIRPDYSKYDFILDVGNAVHQAYLDALESSPQEEVEENIWTYFQKYVVGQMVYVARMAYLTALLVDQIWSDDPTWLKNIRSGDLNLQADGPLLNHQVLAHIINYFARISEVPRAEDPEQKRSHLMALYSTYRDFGGRSNAYAPSFMPDPKRTADEKRPEFQGLQKASESQRRAVLQNVKLPAPPDLVNPETGMYRRSGIGEQELAQRGMAYSDDYWQQLYRHLIPIYLKRVVDLELLRSRVAKLEADPLGAEVIPIDHQITIKQVESSEGDSREEVKCRFYRQQKYLLIDQLYREYSRLSGLIGAVTITQSRTQAGTSRGAPCIIDDQFYYISRLFQEVPNQALEKINRLVTLYQTQSGQLTQSFLDLIPTTDRRKVHLTEGETADNTEDVTTPEVVVDDGESSGGSLIKRIISFRADLEDFEEKLRKECLSQEKETAKKRLQHTFMVNSHDRSYRTIQPNASQQTAIEAAQPRAEATLVSLDQSADKGSVAADVGEAGQPIGLTEINQLYQQADEYLDQIERADVSSGKGLRGVLGRFLADQKVLPDILKYQDIEEDTEKIASEIRAIEREQINDQQSLRQHYKKRARPTGFQLWQESQPEYNPEAAGGLSYQEFRQQLIRRWLELPAEQRKIWQNRSTVTPIEFNQCLDNELRPAADPDNPGRSWEEKWDRIERWARYIYYFRYYMILIKHLSNQQNRGLPTLERPGQAWDQFLSDLKKNPPASGFFSKDNLKNPRVQPWTGSAPIGDQERTVVFHVSMKQIKEILNFLKNQLKEDSQTSNDVHLNQENGYLTPDFWKIIDCMDHPEVQATQIDEDLLNKVEEIMHYIFLRDLYENYYRIQNFDPENYQKIVDLLLKLIARHEQVEQTSSAEIDLSIKYHFYALFKKLMDKKKKRKGAKYTLDQIEEGGDPSQLEDDPTIPTGLNDLGGGPIAFQEGQSTYNDQDETEDNDTSFDPEDGDANISPADNLNF